MTYTLPDPAGFEHKIEHKNTHLVVLKNRSGMQVAFTDYGARIVSVLVPDKFGDLRDVVLGFNSIQEYIDADEQYHGATIGRYANRIANGKFTIGNESYTLDQNNGRNCLHGGPTGFHTKVWDRQVSFTNKIDFYYVSKDGEEGFPGNLKVCVSYELTEDNEIIISYKAETDKETVVNLTNHAYFNLDGEGHSDILQHWVTIPADNFIPINEYQIPEGEEMPVDGTAFDFRSAKQVITDINGDETQLAHGNGYDHSFVNSQPFSLPAASAYATSSGIKLDVFTTEPAVQFYTGNFLTGTDKGKSGGTYFSRTAFCFETQHYPDSPNQSTFPSTILNPGEVFESKTIYRFSIQKGL
ncbi:aldose epimerase family protein [Sphingobacterium deserti]|uniref:Aldose 1-epimerase n=1 Tax=Sphingobacterium deserti TaxID=1229276 RepID=A0A0B8T854_9SPHI|nr:aldose epimerase family protein [Sphingobacterium deserti]KGE14080.1 aldose 1-epimerase [Sphingobacterium deserti]